MNTYCLLDKLKVRALRYFNLSQDANYVFPTETRWEGNSEVITVEINDNSPDLLKLFKDSMVSFICRQVLPQRL